MALGDLVIFLFYLILFYTCCSKYSKRKFSIITTFQITFYSMWFLILSRSGDKFYSMSHDVYFLCEFETGDPTINMHESEGVSPVNAM